MGRFGSWFLVLTQVACMPRVSATIDLSEPAPRVEEHEPNAQSHDQAGSTTPFVEAEIDTRVTTSNPARVCGHVQEVIRTELVGAGFSPSLFDPDEQAEILARCTAEQSALRDTDRDLYEQGARCLLDSRTMDAMRACDAL